MHESDIGELTSKPATYFSSPMEIVNSDKLETNAKYLALKRWEFEVSQVDVTSEENMNAISKTTLQEVRDALRALGHDAAPGEK